METAHAIEVGHAHEQQGLRLLELPPELLEYVRSWNQASSVLAIKAAAESSANDTNAQEHSHIVLCTASDTYSIRQVQVSNTLFVVRPTTHGGLSAFAKCGSFLEVSSDARTQDQKLQEAVRWIRKLIPVYKSEQMQNATPMSMTRLYNDVPLADNQIREAWNCMVGFEVDSRAYRPSGDSLLALWEDMHQALTSQGFRWSDPVFKDTLWQSLNIDDIPEAMFHSFISQCSTQDNDNEMIFDAEKTVRAVGLALVSSGTVDQPDATLDTVLEKWREHLPDEWSARVHATELTTLSSIVDRQLHVAGEQESQSSPAAKPQRNWHEKFKRQRRQ